MCVCACVCVCVCVCVYIRISAPIFVFFVHVCMYTRMCIHAQVCL